MLEVVNCGKLPCFCMFQRSFHVSTIARPKRWARACKGSWARPGIIHAPQEFWFQTKLTTKPTANFLKLE